MKLSSSEELSKRSTNVVYNLLPEIVARLPEHVEDGVEGGAVARVQYIMQFVEKEPSGHKPLGACVAQVLPLWDGWFLRILR